MLKIIIAENYQMQSRSNTNTNNFETAKDSFAWVLPT
jgi:hypothetical protein